MDRTARLSRLRARRRARVAERARRVSDRSRARWSRTAGLDIAPAEFEDHVVEEHVEHSNALHSRLRERGAYLAGPMARYELNFDRLSPLAQEAAREAGLGETSRNPFKSIVVRAVEILYAFDEAVRIIDAYEPPDRPAVERRAARRARVTAGPRRRAACCTTRYELDDEGKILHAKIVPPTSQNQKSIDEDLLGVVKRDDRRPTRRSCASAASRRSATTTPASPARRTSCASMSSTSSAVVVGIGNAWRGRRRGRNAGRASAARQLAGGRSAGRARGRADRAARPVAGSSLAIVVDAIAGAGRPGSVRCFDATDAPLPASFAGGVDARIHPRPSRSSSPAARSAARAAARGRNRGTGLWCRRRARTRRWSVAPKRPPRASSAWSVRTTDPESVASPDEPGGSPV